MPSEAERSQISNAIGLVKSAIGDCVDEIPHADIQKRLWGVVGMLYAIRASAPYPASLDEAVRMAVAQGWCVSPNTSKPMDCDLADAIVKNVIAALAKEGLLK